LVVNELVSNSLKYAFPEKRKGEITVTLKEIEDRLIVGVHDDGIGLSSDKQQNMGESFGSHNCLLIDSTGYWISI